MDIVKIFVIGVLLVLVGAVSAIGFTSFIEPVFFKKTKPEFRLPFQEPSRETSGFAVENRVATPTATPILSLSPTVTITTRYDKHALFLTFENLSLVSSIDYTLLYQALGVSKGVKGNVIRTQREQNILREILLGTCSGVVCTYDEGVTIATVSATFTLEDSSIVKVEKTQTL